MTSSLVNFFWSATGREITQIVDWIENAWDLHERLVKDNDYETSE